MENEHLKIVTRLDPTSLHIHFYNAMERVLNWPTSTGCRQGKKKWKHENNGNLFIVRAMNPFYEPNSWQARHSMQLKKAPQKEKLG